MSDIIFNDKNEVIDATQKGKNDLKILAQNNRLSEKFVLENADFLDWNIISENQVLTVEIMVTCAKKIKWAKAVTNPNIYDDAVLLIKYKGNLLRMFQQEVFNEDFTLKYMDFFEKFIEEFHEKLDWKYIFGYKKLATFFKKIGSSKVYKDNYYF